MAIDAVAAGDGTLYTWSMGFEPSEVTVMLPVALPVPVGANFTVKLTV